MYEEQTKEQRQAGEKRKYIGNGKVFWTDGNITKAEAVAKETATTSAVDSDLPF